MTLNTHSITDNFSTWEADLLNTKNIIPKRIDSKDEEESIEFSSDVTRVELPA